MVHPPPPGRRTCVCVFVRVPRLYCIASPPLRPRGRGARGAARMSHIFDPDNLAARMMHIFDPDNLDFNVSLQLLASSDPSTIGGSGDTSEGGTISIREAIKRGLPGVFKNPSKAMLLHIKDRYGASPPHDVTFEGVHGHMPYKFTVNMSTVDEFGATAACIITFNPPRGGDGDGDGIVG